jgi:hypothetical protein
MKPLKFPSILFLIVLIVSACSPKAAAPTINAAEVQSTAAAAAFTMVAQTLAAVPTVTPLPPTETPTETPMVTNTPVELPTLALSPTTAVQAAAATSAGADPCSTRVLSGPKGKETTIRIVNTTKVPVKVSIYLNETAGQGACGWGYLELAKNADTVITSWVQGCYNLWAWSDDAKGKFNSSGGGCINNSDKWTFEVSSGSIKFIGP